MKVGDRVIIYDRNGAVVSRSKNLRGLLEYSRRVCLDKVSIEKTAHGEGIVRLTFGSGATVETMFASYSVLVDFLNARRRWEGVEVTDGEGRDLFVIGH